MKNLMSFLQKSFLIFVVLFAAACEKDAEHTLPGSLPFESLQVLPQVTDLNRTPPILIPEDRLENPGTFKYLTLTDASLKNVVAIKIKTEDKNLLNSLNSETVELIVIDRPIPGSTSFEQAKVNHVIELRSALKPVEIEVIETRLQNNVILFGIKFVKTELIPADGLYEFTFKNSNVKAVHATGRDAIKYLPSFTVLASDCPDCESYKIALQSFNSRMVISFSNSKKSSISLKVNSKFTDDLMILW